MVEAPIPVGAYGPVELAAGVFATGTALLGLFISYLAYRGLRRTGSRQMRYLSVGMMVLFGLTYALALLGQSLITVHALPLVYQSAFRLVVRVLQFAGLALIAYSLWMGSGSSGTGASSD